MRKTVCYILAMLALSSCIYPYSVDISDELEEKSLVIDANILLGNTSTISLSYVQPLNVGQRVAVSERPQGKVFLEDSEGGVYDAVIKYNSYSIPSFPVKENTLYRLTVVVDGKTYRSQWIEPTAPPEITGIRFTSDERMVYVMVSILDSGEGSGYASASFEEIWKFHTDYMRLYSYDPETGVVSALMYPDDSHYWCWNKYLASSQYILDYSSLEGEIKDYVIYSFPRTSNRNHEEYNIRLKIWNLTPEQYKFRKMLEDNESIGANLFSPEPGEIRGNVYCETNSEERVFGYVNVSRVAVKDAVLLSPYYLSKTPESLVEVAPENYAYMYSQGYSPIESMEGENGLVVGWGQGRCYDCIIAGGTLEKPSFE